MQLRVSSCVVFCQTIFPRGFLSYLVKEKFFLLLYSGVLFIQLFCACQIHMWSRLHIQSYHYSNGWHIFRLNGPCSVLQSIATLTVWVTKTRNTWKRKFWTDIWYESLKASTAVKKIVCALIWDKHILDSRSFLNKLKRFKFSYVNRFHGSTVSSWVA